jgi:hypothetical protein
LEKIRGGAGASLPLKGAGWLSKNLLPKPKGRRFLRFGRRRLKKTKLRQQGLPPAATVKKRNFFQVAAVSRPACRSDAQNRVIFAGNIQQK